MHEVHEIHGAAGILLAAMVIITAVLISTSKVEEFRIGGRDE